MAQPTNSYVDPSIAANSGAGTVGDPWGDIQYGLDQVTRDSTNGDRMNIKAGTDEILAAALSLATYGSPTLLAPLILQGYTSAAEDGGTGGISGDGSVGVFGGDVLDSIGFKGLHMHNCGSADVISLDNDIWLEDCEIDNTTGGGLDLDSASIVVNCHIHNIGGIGINVGGGAVVFGNYLANGTNKFSSALTFSNGTVHSNVINLSGSANASNGIRYADKSYMWGNSIWSDAGTGSGIEPSGSARDNIIIVNNIAEGFSGSGGIGIDLSSDDSAVLYGTNATYNNATNYSNAGDVVFDLGDNEVLGASPFADPSTGDFTVDTSVRATGFPLTFKGSSTDQALDKGAAQRVEPAGGGGGLLTHPGMDEGLVA